MDWINAVTTLHPEFTYAGSAILKLNLKQRSALIKCCQAQIVPKDPSSSLYQQVARIGSIRGARLSYHDPIYYFEQYFSLYIDQRPVSAAIILDLARSCPLPKEEIEEARQNSWNKELVCCETEGKPNYVNWSILFRPGLEDIPLIPTIRPNPKMILAIRSSIRQWINQVRSVIHYPRYTHKNMSRDTRREVEESQNISLENVPIFGQDDWLRIYHMTGLAVGGACEMRQKWYPSGAKPRTYYAQGGTSYQHSMHLQEIFTMLVNSSPVTHHISRLQPTRLTLRDGAHYRIYDLSTFTSNMHEQKYFVRELANACTGITVRIFDVVEGLQHRDLGDMLWEYNENTNFHPEVSYERMNRQGGPDFHIGEHSTASMLGIFGNLMTCTFAHAALMMQTVEQEDEVNVAGDDGQVLEREDRKDEQDQCICALGDYEMDKTFSSEEEGCICLKRPLDEQMGVLVHGTMCIPPSLSLLSQMILGISDPRYDSLDESLHVFDRLSVVGKDMMRFLRSVHRSSWKLSDDQLQLAIDLYRGSCRLIKRPALYNGCLPAVGDPFFFPCLPTLEDLRERDPYVTLVYARFQGHVNIPCTGYESVPLDSDLYYSGFEFISNRSRRLRLLETLGYVKMSRLSRRAEGQEGIDHLIDSFFRQNLQPILYNVVVNRDVPAFLLT